MRKYIQKIAWLFLFFCSLTVNAQGFMGVYGNEGIWYNIYDGVEGTFKKGDNGLYGIDLEYLGVHDGSFGLNAVEGYVLDFQSAVLGNYSTWKRILTCQPSGDVIEIPVIGNSESTVSFVDMPDYIQQLPDITKDGKRVLRLSVNANTSTTKREAQFTAKINELNQKMWFIQPGCDAPSFEEQKKILKVLYDSTDGDNWKDNTNWLSDKPINLWHGVNNDIWGTDTIIGNYVLRLGLYNNSLKGKMPAELAKLIPSMNTVLSSTGFDPDLPWGMTLDKNFLYGKIPAEIKNHPSWKELGWHFICQDNWCKYSGMFDWADFNLQTDDAEFTYMLEDKVGTVKDVLQKNKYTLVFSAGLSYFPAWWLGISNKRINLFLDYCNKGFGMVAVAGTYAESDPGEYGVDYVKQRLEEGMPSDILWINNKFGNADFTNIGNAYLFDKEGNLLQFWGGFCDYDWFLEQVSDFLRQQLGEPDKHEPFVSSLYTSTDYSKDGEVTILQTATEGSGVDIVFLGECFVDTDMEPGGLYEQMMQEAMEQFFAEEPYRSMRNRFNVYAVKAVSPNAVYDSNTKLAIGGDIEKAFEYAKKAVGGRDDRLMVGVICKPGAIYGRSCTFMFEEDGSFASWMFEGVSEVLNHEMGGHGVAFLLDEYIELGQGEMSPSEDAKIELDNNYALYGEGANVDYRSDPSEVKWAHFINDPRYSSEGIGVYEGSWLYGHGAYRPTRNSMMRYNDCGFNAPSREAIYKRVMKLSEGDSWTYDYETFVKFDTQARKAYSRARARSRSHSQDDDNNDVQQKQIESRPPVIYKGTWRDAGKCEKLEYRKK